MDKFNFTPGPWTMESAVNAEGSELTIVTPDYQFSIADAYFVHADGMSPTYAEAVANARAIAALPDLVAALEGMLSAPAIINCDYGLWSTADPENYVRARIARDALAKVRG